MQRAHNFLDLRDAPPRLLAHEVLRDVWPVCLRHPARGATALDEVEPGRSGRVVLALRLALELRDRGVVWGGRRPGLEGGSEVEGLCAYADNISPSRWCEVCRGMVVEKGRGAISGL